MLNTFLTHSCFYKTAKSLDRKRLIKQAVETIQILNALEKRRLKVNVGWKNHPAVVQWEGYEDTLKHYFNVMREEILHRGYSFPKRILPNTFRI